MAASTDEKPAIDSFSDAEKHNDQDKLAGFEDPDAGLSDEERAKIVCVLYTLSTHFAYLSRNVLQDRKLLWKLDLRLVPWLSLLYLVSFLDR